MTLSTPSNENLTERLRLFGAIATSISVLGVMVHVLTVSVLVEPSAVLSPALYSQLAGCICPMLTWALCLQSRTTIFCRTLETLSLAGTAASLTFMAQFLTTVNVPDLSPLPIAAIQQIVETHQERFSVLACFAIAMIYIVRSAIVPSRTKWTVALGFIIGGIIIIAPLWEGHAPRVAISTFSLWLLAIAVSAELTHVIHGLRREIAKIKKLGQYTLGEKLGEGGMGTVFRATHAFLRRPTAVKLLQEERAGQVNIQRFEREVQITAQLKHPNTITIYDYGRTPDGVFYYAMELIEGRTLQDIVDAEGPQPEKRITRILHMVAGALAEAHDLGIVHRDIKPSNIMVGTRGGVPDFATVLDFGLVRETNTSKDLTSVGVLVGTPMYLAPELIKGQAASPASDIYALGGVGYFMLTGKTVFDGETVVDICADHLHTTPTLPSEMLGRPVSADLEALLMQCLSKQPSERPSARAF